MYLDQRAPEQDSGSLNSKEIMEAARLLLEQLQELQAEPLWTAEDLAAFLQVSKRHVLERIIKAPQFPRPVRLPAAKGRGPLRWKPSDIRSWVDRHSQ